MSKVDEAKEILKGLGLPTDQQNKISAYTLLALAGIGPTSRWRDASSKSLRISKGIMTFIQEVYGQTYAANTRETFRRQVLHQFIQAGIVAYNPDNPKLPTNSPQAHYALTGPCLAAIRAFNSRSWEREQKRFLAKVGSLLAAYKKERDQLLVEVMLPDGREVRLSPGSHNQLQAAIVQQFAARFLKTPILIYMGDTAKKASVIQTSGADELNIPLTEHDKLPDLIFLDSERSWLVLVEAVTSHGPMSPNVSRN